MSRPLRYSSIHMCILLLVCAHSGLSLAVPSVTQAPVARLRNKRADDIATKYGFFDSLNSYGSESAPDDPGIARIPEVFMAIAQQTDGSLMTPLTSGPTPTQPLEEGVTAYPSAPPYGGPGLVVISSQQLPAIGLATQLPTAPSSSGKRPSKRALIFGSVIGALLLFTLLMFIVLDPAITGKLCGTCFRSRKKTAATKVKEEKTADKDATQWVDVVPLTANVGDETFVEGEKSTSKQGKEDDTLLEANSSQSRAQSQSPPSKFSICSESEYSDSQRNSALSSNSAITSNARKSASVTFSPGPTPVRPPRPPTADSPTLSESVYLANACSDQPYVVVAPQPITEADTKNPPRRIMTPSEFFALHAPSVIKSFRPSSSSSAKKDDNASISRTDDEPESSANRESGHSRTKSAPLLGPTKTRGCTSSAEFDSDDSSFQGPMIQRITKHRRSRSASGWAYPDRPASRK